MASVVAGIATACAVLCLGSVSFAENIEIQPGDPGVPSNLKLNLPFAFYNENFGAAVGYVYSVVGYPERQSALLASAMAGSKGSGLFFMMGRDIRVPGVSRLFCDPIFSIGYFASAKGYIDGNPDFPAERAGSNDSDTEDYVSGDGWDNFVRLKFKYLLPIGYGKEHLVNDYQVRGGMLQSGASGAESWNPLASGKTFLSLRPFYRSQQISGDYVDSSQKTNGFDLEIFWDNRDFGPNPSQGNGLKFKVSRDFGWANSSNSWSEVEGEWDQYFSLGASKWFRQRVVALDVWTAYSPSWEVQQSGTVANGPPAYTGATLGGLVRMRGYPSQRFSDKAAIYYGAEMRLTPDWNPFLAWPALQRHLGIQWVQIVPFAEVGRVSPDWDLDTLHSEMKWDGGLGIRLLAKGLVVRIDMAASGDGGSVQMFVGQPFQF